jgi:hypothetical protein
VFAPGAGITRHSSNESADDQALLNKLAYWCNADEAAMIRAFLRSPHFTQKDEAHRRKLRIMSVGGGTKNEPGDLRDNRARPATRGKSLKTGVC